MIDDDRHLIYYNAKTTKGNSGGPIFVANLETLIFEVAGVHNGYDAKTDCNFGTSMKAFDKSNFITYDLPDLPVDEQRIPNLQ